MSTVKPSTTPLSVKEAMRYYQGDISDNSEFNNYWNLYGDPPDSQDWWVQNDKPTQQATNWYNTAQTGGNRVAAEQAASDKDNLLGSLGPIARIGAMIPGPWQPFAAAASAMDSASTGDWLGALGAGYGAYSGFTSPSFKNPFSGIGDLFNGSSANMETGAYSPGGMSGSTTEYNPSQFKGWNSDGVQGFDPATADFGNVGFDPGAEGMYGMGGGGGGGMPLGDESMWFDGMSPSQLGTANGGLLPNIPGSSESFLSKLFKGLTNQLPGSDGKGGYSFPWGNAISSLLGAVGQRGTQKDLQSLMDQARQAQDPFAGERPGYQSQLRGLATNPSGFFQDPAISSAINEAMNLSNRSLVAQGYNSSGNQKAELTKVAQNEAFKQYMPYLRQIGQFAGAEFGPGNVGSVVGNIGTSAANAGTAVQGNLGAGLASILQGNQPSLLAQMQGQPQNQGLVDVFKNALA